MSKILPGANTPAETLDISPEALEVANCYLVKQNIEEVANLLDIPVTNVSIILSRKEVRAYIDHVFFDVGYNNRFKMRAAIDAIILHKFRELEEAQTGSNKDISELLALSHKITMEQMDKQIELEKLRASNIKNQVNVQINENGISGGSKYAGLLNQLMKLEE